MKKLFKISYKVFLPMMFLWFSAHLPIFLIIISEGKIMPFNRSKINEIKTKYKQYSKKYYSEFVDSEKLMSFEEFQKIENITKFDTKKYYSILTEKNSKETKYVIARIIQARLKKQKNIDLLQLYTEKFGYVGLFISIYVLLLILLLKKMRRKLLLFGRYTRINYFNQLKPNYRKKLIRNKYKTYKRSKFINYFNLLVFWLGFLFYITYIVVPFIRLSYKSSIFQPNYYIFSITVLLNFLVLLLASFLIRRTLRQKSISKFYALQNINVILIYLLFNIGITVIFDLNSIKFAESCKTEFKKTDLKIEQLIEESGLNLK